jgi:hypothetical protein
LSAGWRKCALTVHVLTSVGWLGAVVASAALALLILASDEAATVRASYIALDELARYVLLPLSVLALLSGIVQGLVSTWGVLRHHWVVTKLCVNLVSAVILLLYAQTLGALSDAARRGAQAVHDPSPLLHTVGALVLLTCATALSIYKPRGRTRRGWRKHQELIRPT